MSRSPKVKSKFSFYTDLKPNFWRVFFSQNYEFTLDDE